MKIQKCLTYFFLSLSVLVIFSCGTPKEYAASDFDLPESFQIPDSVGKKLDTMLIPRHKFFKDSVLKDLINTALQKNFEIRKSDKQMEINETLYKQSKAAFYPSVDLNMFTIERRWYSQNSRFSPASGWYEHQGKTPKENLFLERIDNYSGITLNWEADIWGKLRNQKKSALALYEQSHIARRALQTELIATVAEDYYTLLMLDEQLNVAERNHRYRDSTLTMINLLYQSGEVSALAVQQSQTQVLDASSLISKLKEERTILENNLRLLAGELPGNIFRTFRLEVDDSSYEEVKELPLYLIQNRPDVVVAQYGLIRANAEVGVTQAQRWPNLSITLNGGVESLLPQNWFDIPGSLFGSVVGGLTNPIFKNRKLKTQYEIAKLERDRAEIDFQRNVYKAVVDVENTLTSLKRVEDQLEIATVKQLVAQRALLNSRMLFRSGFANYLEVITAQSEAMAAELDLVRTKADLLTLRIQLYRALGGGWN